MYSYGSRERLFKHGAEGFNGRAFLLLFDRRCYCHLRATRCRSFARRDRVVDIGHPSAVDAPLRARRPLR